MRSAKNTPSVKVTLRLLDNRIEGLVWQRLHLYGALSFLFDQLTRLMTLI
jgi:hypothetical protein